MASQIVNPLDTQFLHAALHNWQDRNQNSRTWEQLSQTDRSEIMRDAQTLKTNSYENPLTIDEVLDGSRSRRAWYELQAALAAKASRRSQ